MTRWGRSIENFPKGEARPWGKQTGFFGLLHGTAVWHLWASTSRHDLMLMGVGVWGGTIASNFRGEVRVAFVSCSAGEIKFGPGDDVAKFKVEKVAYVKKVTTTVS